MEIDMDYYLKIQNMSVCNDVRDAMKYEAQEYLNRDFTETLDAHTVLIDGKRKELTILKSSNIHQKKIKSRPKESFSAGQYVVWKDKYWIITDVDANNELFTSGKIQECNILLHWQNDNGKIVSRWAFVQNASSYNNGEDESKTITLESNQFMASLPYDEETMYLENGKRIHISRKKHICKPYELTRPDDVTFGFGENGVLNIIFTQTQYNKERDRFIDDYEDGVWICDYHSPVPSPDIPQQPNETTVLNAKISGGSTLRNGRKKTWTVSFTDSDGNDVLDIDFEWQVVSDFEISQVVVDNKIQLMIDDDSLIGESFLLRVVSDGISLAQTRINIAEAF